MRQLITCVLLLTLTCLPALAQTAPTPDPDNPAGLADGVTRALRLEPSAQNKRNSEGDFIQLKDGSILLGYSHYLGQSGGDHGSAYLAGRISHDHGQTWSDTDTTLVAKTDADVNLMEVSFLRLTEDRIALLYLRKYRGEGNKMFSNIYVRFSDDEAQTWSDPVEVIADNTNYNVINNDRLVRLSSGRLVIPVAVNNSAVCYFSDDDGLTWRRNTGGPLIAHLNNGNRMAVQEPGVVELTDGRVLLWVRTNAGFQYFAHSDDDCETFTDLAPSTLRSPLSPASIERIPSTGDLLCLWNDSPTRKRTPFTAAISCDDGATWENTRPLESRANGWFCYTAIDFVGDEVLLAHCAGGGLAVPQVTRFEVEWLYEEE